MREMDRQTRQIPVNVSDERFLSPHIRSPNETDTSNGNMNFKLDDSMFLDELQFQSRITICMNINNNIVFVDSTMILVSIRVL